MDKKNRELVKNTIIIFLGKACTQLISFFLLPLYTAILSTTEYGVVDLATTYVTLLVPVITLQLEMALFRFLIDARKNEDNKRKIITNGYVTATIMVVITTLIYFIITSFINVQYKIYLCAMVIATIYSNLSLQVSRGNGDNIGYALGSIIAGTSTILFNIFFLVILNWGIKAMFLSISLSNMLCFFFLFIRERLFKYIRFKFLDKIEVKEMLKYSLPLVPNGLIWWIINASDRTIISIVLDAAANGIYAISNKFSTIIIGVYNIFNLSLTESVSLYINDDDKDEFLSGVINNVFNIFSSVCLVVIAWMFIIFPIMIDTKYIDAYVYIPILLLGTLFHVIVSMLGTVYVAKKLTKEVAKTSLYAGILNIGINLICIKYIGIYAAAISTAIAFLIMSLYRYIDVQKYARIKFDKKMLLATIVVFIFAIVIYYINNIVLNILNVLIISCYALYINRKFIKNTFNKVFNRKCKEV